jgi:hypothetical protein
MRYYKRKVARMDEIFLQKKRMDEICENDLTFAQPANETNWSENLQIPLDSGGTKQEQLYHILPVQILRLK